MSVLNRVYESRRQHLSKMSFIALGNLAGIPDDKSSGAADGAPEQSVMPTTGFGGLHIALAHAAAEAHAHWKL